jgi:hypothetical protein
MIEVAEHLGLHPLGEREPQQVGRAQPRRGAETGTPHLAQTFEIEPLERLDLLRDIGATRYCAASTR